MNSTFTFHPLFSPVAQASDPFSGISTPFTTVLIIVLVVLVLWWLLRVQTTQVDEIHVDEHDHEGHAEHGHHQAAAAETAEAGGMVAGSAAAAAAAGTTAAAAAAVLEEDAERAQPGEAEAEADQAAETGEADESGDAGPDDLKKLEGVGPKVEAVLHAAGIKTFDDLAAAQVDHLQSLLDASDYQYMDPGSWPEQARLAAAGDWEALQKLQDELLGGK